VSSLTATAYYARKAIIFSAIVLILIFFGYLGITGFISYWNKAHPPPPPPPNVAFGILPKINFPQQVTPEVTISLETTTGSLTAASASARVYYMPQTSPTFYAPDKAREQATKMGFYGEPIVLSKVIYQWIDKNLPLRKLTIDISKFNVTMSYEVAGDIKLIKEKNLPDSQEAQQMAQSLLDSYELRPADLDMFPKVDYLKWDQNTFTPVESLAEADFVQVRFTRTEAIDGPFVYPKNQALVKIIFSGSTDRAKQIIFFEYRYQTIDYEIYATYPLKTTQEAFELLKQNKAYLGNYLDNQAVVRNVNLGYYENLTEQTYVQPVFIFTGDNDFAAYVPAVKEKWSKDD